MDLLLILVLPVFTLVELIVLVSPPPILKFVLPVALELAVIIAVQENGCLELFVLDQPLSTHRVVQLV